jgi:acyl carrier protein
VKALEQEIKELIISSLSLEDMTPDDIDTDAPLFVEGLGLDSIDALELGLALQRRYGIVLEGDKAQMKARFASVAALAGFVASQRASQGAGQPA